MTSIVLKKPELLPINPYRRSNRQALLLCTLCIAILLCSSSVWAQSSLRKFGGVEFGYSTYQFDQKIDQKLVFPTAGLTGGLSYGRYNLLLSYTFSLDSAEVSEEDFTGKADREDIDLVIVRQISKQFSLFAGYKLGETKLTSRTREDDEDDPGPSRKETFKQTGFFIGASTNWIMENAGRLSLSIAYADLDAKNQFVKDDDDDDDDPDEALEFDDISGTAKGSSTGYSINLTWTLPLKGNWLYRSRLRFNRYKQDIKFEGNTFKNIDENSTSLLMGVVYVF